MPPKWSSEIFGAASMLLGVVLGLFLMRKRLPITPRQTRKRSWRVLAFTVLPCAFAAFVFWKSDLPQHKAIVVVSIGGVAMAGASALYQYFRSPPAHETLQNFAADSRHCGQCEYDLTGNVSGVCPECGWQIPQGKLDVDTPGWPLWWRQWPIDHLRNWRATLALVTIFAFLFAVTAVVFAVYFKGIVGAVLPALMAAHMSVNAIRIVAYGRRHSAA